MKLPTLDKAPARAARPSLQTVRPTDLGLGEVARDVAAVEAEIETTRQLEEEVARTDAEETVRPLLERFQTEFDGEFAEAGAQWDGVAPGFARGQTSRLSERRTGFGDDQPLTSVERDALERGLNRYGEGVSQRAIQYESQRRGGLAVEAAAARDGAVTGRLTGDYMSLMGARQAERDAAFDGSTDDYEAGSLADHDLVAMEILSRTPEALKPRVTQQLQAERLRVQARAMHIQVEAEKAYVVGQVRQAGDLTLNALLTAPTMYEQAMGQLDQLVAPLPANVRPAERARLSDGYSDAYVTGLIEQGQEDQAISLLEGGTLDARLQPGTKARLLERAVRKRDEPSPGDMVAQMQASLLARDNLASIEATGRGIDGADPASLAMLMSPAEAARYTLQIDEARRTFAAMPGYDGMSAAEINAHVESLRPEAGTAGYAEAQERFERAATLAARTIDARQKDPAAAAMQAAPALAAQLAGLGEGDLNARRRAAAGYVAGMDALQSEWGVPAHQRRVMPADRASAFVAAYEGAPDPGEGLRQLAGLLDAFEPPAGAAAGQIREAFGARTRLITELKAAGADTGDIAAAVDLSGDLVRMGRYVAATRGGALDRLDRGDRNDLNEAVDRELAPYLASFAAAPGSRDLTEGRRVMAQRLAAEALARGGSERDAARAGVEVLAGQYAFVGNQQWRMPRRLAESRIEGVPGERIARQGTARLMATLSLNEGQGFFAPEDRGRGLTVDQRRRRYADTIRTSGRWVTTADDRGLALMIPTLEGGWHPALSSEGRPITYSWPQILAAGEQRGPDGRVALGSGRNQTNLPRGIRNNNPGNIEFRPTNAWRGQTGSDGRFARFATPEAGLRALAIDLGTKSRRGLTTVRSILNTYAPPSDNDTAAYIRSVARELGVDPNARIDLNDPRVRGGLMGAIIQHENGSQPYDNALIGRIAAEAVRGSR